MSKTNVCIFLFACFAMGLPLWGMQANGDGGGNIHSCTGPCYEQWKSESGGVVAPAEARAR